MVFRAEKAIGSATLGEGDQGGDGREDQGMGAGRVGRAGIGGS